MQISSTAKIIQFLKESDSWDSYTLCQSIEKGFLKYRKVYKISEKYYQIKYINTSGWNVGKVWVHLCIWSFLFGSSGLIDQLHICITSSGCT